MAESIKNLTLSAASTLNPNWSLNHVELLLAHCVNDQTKASCNVITALLRTGHVSSFRSPQLLDHLLLLGEIECIRLYLTCVKDIRAGDLAKCLLFLLSQTESTPQLKQVMSLIFTKEFNSAEMTSSLREFGSIQTQTLLGMLVESFQEGHEFATIWLSLVIDAQFSLMILQPLFFPFLKAIHELLAQSIQETTELESMYSMVAEIVKSDRLQQCRSNGSNLLQYKISPCVDL